MVLPQPVCITVGIVTYRSDRTKLTAAIDSLRASTVPVEVVIVDNSQDETYFAQLQQVPNVRVVRSSRNGGYGFGHNIALKESNAGAPYHLILNPDVVVQPGCLETLVKTLDTQPDVALAMPLIQNPDGSIQHLNKRDPAVIDLFIRRFLPGFLRRLPIVQRRMDYYVRMDIGYDKPSEIPYASGCFMLFRRSVLDAIHGFDERYFMYFEDADISREARAKGRILFVPEARITHHWARGSHTNWKLMWCTIASAGKYFRKWGWKLW